jgi:hypothetical protein
MSASSSHPAERSHRTLPQFAVWVVCLGVVPLMAWLAGYMLVQGLNGQPGTVWQHRLIWFLIWAVGPLVALLVGSLARFRSPRLAAMVLLAVPAVWVWYMVIYVVLVLAGVWVGGNGSN